MLTDEQINAVCGNYLVTRYYDLIPHNNVDQVITQQGFNRAAREIERLAVADKDAEIERIKSSHGLSARIAAKDERERIEHIAIKHIEQSLDGIEKMQPNALRDRLISNVHYARDLCRRLFEVNPDAEVECAQSDAVTKAVEARDAELKNILSKVSDGAKERSARMDSAYGKAYFEDVSALIKFMVSELFPSGKDESNG